VIIQEFRLGEIEQKNQQQITKSHPAHWRSLYRAVKVKASDPVAGMVALKRQAAPKGRLIRSKPVASLRYFLAAFTPR
jgi:hypothetical protein